MELTDWSDSKWKKLDKHEKINVIASLTGLEILKVIARFEDDDDVRLAAINKITRDYDLVEILKFEKCNKLIRVIIDKISDKSELKYLNSSRSLNPNLYRILTIKDRELSWSDDIKIYIEIIKSKSNTNQINKTMAVDELYKWDGGNTLLDFVEYLDDDILGMIASKYGSYDFKEEIISCINNQEILYNLATKVDLVWTSLNEFALKRIKNDDMLIQTALKQGNYGDAYDAKTQIEAINRVDDQTVLSTIAGYDNLFLSVAAINRLTDLYLVAKITIQKELWKMQNHSSYDDHYYSDTHMNLGAKGNTQIAIEECLIKAIDNIKDRDDVLIEIASSFDNKVIRNRAAKRIQAQTLIEEYKSSNAFMNFKYTHELLWHSVDKIEDVNIITKIADSTDDIEVRLAANTKLGRQKLLLVDEFLHFQRDREKRKEIAKQLVSIAYEQPDILLKHWDVIRNEINAPHTDFNEDNTEGNGEHWDGHHDSGGFQLNFPDKK